MPVKPARIILPWRKDLVHFNKTRDNHLARLGTYHDVTVLIRRSARLGNHIWNSQTKFVRAPADRLIPFYRWAQDWSVQSHGKIPYDIVLGVVGEEPAAHRIWKKLKTPSLAFDLWDVPGIISLPMSSPKRLIAPIYRAAIYRATKDAELVAVTGKVSEYKHLFSSDSRCIELTN